MVGVFGGKMEARAAGTCCLINSPFSCNPCEQAGTCDVCTGIDFGIVVDCSSSECTGAGKAKCCIRAIGGCVDMVTGNEDCIGTKSLSACAGLADCKPKNCCVDSSKNPKECKDPNMDGSCSGIAGTLQSGVCSTHCTADTGNGGGTGEGGTSGGSTPTSTEFINPLKVSTIDGVLTSLLTALSGLVVTLAIIFIVLGGILYMMSAGDPGMIKRAKDCWLFSVIGLAIVVAAPTFLKEVQTILGGSVPDSTGKIASALTVGAIATNVLNFLLSIVGIIAIISLVIAGGMYMTAYGDDTRIGTAKKMGTYAIVGIVVALVSLIAVQQVSKLITG